MGSKGRNTAWCPGCPPGFRPLRFFFGGNFTDGGSLDGGFDELLEFWFSRRSRASSRASSSCTRARSAAFSDSRSWIRATRTARSRNQRNRTRRLSRRRPPRQLFHPTLPSLPVNGYVSGSIMWNSLLARRPLNMGHLDRADGSLSISVPAA